MGDIIPRNPMKTQRTVDIDWPETIPAIRFSSTALAYATANQMGDIATVIHITGGDYVVPATPSKIPAFTKHAAFDMCTTERIDRKHIEHLPATP